MSILTFASRPGLASGHGMDDMNARAATERRVEPLEEADVLALQKDVHVRPQLAGFVTEIEAQAGVFPFERVDHLTDRSARCVHLPLIACALPERGRDP